MGSRPTSGTSSRSSTSSSTSVGELRAHTAVHVLKGAVRKVLGPRRFNYAEEGVLRFDGEGALEAEDVEKVGEAANKKIAEDEEVLEFSMEREEAEGHFGTGIYDLNPAPQGGELVRIVRISGWEASSCPRKHVESTGEIGEVRMDGASFDGATRQVEITFHLA